MYFTQEDYRKIEKWLLANSKKDTQFVEAATPLQGNETITFVQNGKNVKTSVKDIVDQLFLLGVSDFLNITDKYGEKNITINQAIQLIPFRSRKIGQVITFLDEDGNWRIYQFKGNIHQWNMTSLWEDILDFDKYVINSILPDEEDLTKSLPDTNGNSYLKFKDKEYDPDNYSGLGRVYLRKNIVEVEDPDNPICGKITKNLLYQDMIDKPNTIYIIQYDYDLNGQEIEIPENCVLQFEGGSLRNGTVKGKDTKIVVKSNKVVFYKITFNGKFINSVLRTSYFGLVSDLHTEKKIWTYKNMNIDIEVYTGTDNSIMWDSVWSIINNSYGIELIIDGEYYVNSNWKTLTLKNAQHLKIHGGVVDIAIYLRSCHDIDIYDVTFIGLHKPHETPKYCTKVENISDDVFHVSEGLYNLGFNNEAIAVQTLVDNEEFYSYNIHISNCKFYMRSNALMIGTNRTNTDTAKDIIIENCVSDSIFYQTIGLHCSNTIVNNIITFRNGQSVDISSGCHYVVVNNCRCNSDYSGPKQDSTSKALDITINNELKNSYFNIVENKYVDLSISMLLATGPKDYPFNVSDCIFESTADNCFIIRCSDNTTLNIKGCKFIKKEGVTNSLVTYTLDTNYRGIVNAENCDFTILSKKHIGYPVLNGVNGEFNVLNSKINLGDNYQRWGSNNPLSNITFYLKNSYLLSKFNYNEESYIKNILFENSIININSPIDITQEGCIVKIINNYINSETFIARARASNSKICIIGNQCLSRGVLMHGNVNDLELDVSSNNFNSSFITTNVTTMNAIFEYDNISPTFNAKIYNNIFMDENDDHTEVWVINSASLKKSFKYFGLNKYIGKVQGYDTFPISPYGYNPYPEDKFIFYDKTKMNFHIAFDGKYYDFIGNPKDANTLGPSSERPVEVKAGFFYKDTTLNKPIWWDGSQWVDATGAQV